MKLRCAKCDGVVPLWEAVGMFCRTCHEKPTRCLMQAARPFADASYVKVYRADGPALRAAFSPAAVLALRDVFTYWEALLPQPLPSEGGEQGGSR